MCFNKCLYIPTYINKHNSVQSVTFAETHHVYIFPDVLYKQNHPDGHCPKSIYRHFLTHMINLHQNTMQFRQQRQTLIGCVDLFDMIIIITSSYETSA